MIIFYDENKSVGGKVDHKFFIIVENVNLISTSKLSSLSILWKFEFRSS
jgi:hypothetical protein